MSAMTTMDSDELRRTAERVRIGTGGYRPDGLLANHLLGLADRWDADIAVIHDAVGQTWSLGYRLDVAEAQLLKWESVYGQFPGGPAIAAAALARPRL